MDTTTLMLPADQVHEVRSGAYLTIETLASEFSDLTASATRERTPGRYTPLLEQLLGTWALLDELGWTDRFDDGAPIELNLSTHSKALRAALAQQIDAEPACTHDTGAQPGEAWERTTDLRLLLEHVELCTPAATQPRTIPWLERTKAAAALGAKLARRWRNRR